LYVIFATKHKETQRIFKKAYPSCLQADKDTPYGSLTRALRWLLLHYFDIKLMRNQRRIGEALTIASGIGLVIGGFSLGVMSIVYGGLAIVGLGMFSVFWDW
jgi:hypothetical protein